MHSHRSDFHRLCRRYAYVGGDAAYRRKIKSKEHEMGMVMEAKMVVIFEIIIVVCIGCVIERQIFFEMRRTKFRIDLYAAQMQQNPWPNY